MAGSFRLDIRADIRPLQRALDDLARKQLPYASALTLTALAKRVQAEETRAIAETFDHPTPFTQRAIGVKAATKATQTALVFAKDIQAQYLQPFLNGGRQLLRGKVGLPVPIDARTNQYGNLPKGAIARMKAQPNVFFGKVKLRDGRTISGIWQRPGNANGGARPRAANHASGARARGSLKLLVEWTSGVEVHQRLDYRPRAARVIAAYGAIEFGAAMKRALSSARR